MNPEAHNIEINLDRLYVAFYNKEGLELLNILFSIYSRPFYLYVIALIALCMKHNKSLFMPIVLDQLEHELKLIDCGKSKTAKASTSFSDIKSKINKAWRQNRLRDLSTRSMNPMVNGRRQFPSETQQIIWDQFLEISERQNELILGLGALSTQLNDVHVILHDKETDFYGFKKHLYSSFSDQYKSIYLSGAADEFQSFYESIVHDITARYRVDVKKLICVIRDERLRIALRNQVPINVRSNDIGWVSFIIALHPNISDKMGPSVLDSILGGRTQDQLPINAKGITNHALLYWDNLKNRIFGDTDFNSLVSIIIDDCYSFDVDTFASGKLSLQHSLSINLVELVIGYMLDACQANGSSRIISIVNQFVAQLVGE